MNNKVSVIVPVYNGAKTIKKCIENIKKNNKNNFKEIIVINDNSNDNTKQILEKIKNIKIINFKTNKGVGYARHYGAKIAKQKVLCYIDLISLFHPIQ